MSLEETILEWFSPPFDRNVRDAILLLKKEPKKDTLLLNLHPIV